MRSFRLICADEEIPAVEDLLRAQGFDFAPDPLWPKARRLLSGPLPLGLSVAAAFGLLYIQDRSSMLPPLALAPEKGAAVLDVCASPGSKTSMLGQMVGNGGFVLGNEPSKKRLGTLRRNVQALNLLQCATCSHPGENLSLFPADASPGFTRIQLDPPCSGWGTADKHPDALRLWRDDRLGPLMALQRRLLERSAALLAPGGRLAYSTCTTNTTENEAQVRHAVEVLGLELLPLGAPEGVRLEAPALPGCEGVWRILPGAGGQGFFVALLRKPAGPSASSPPGSEAGGSVLAAPPSAGSADFFVRPWERESRFVGERRRHAARPRQKSGAGTPVFLDAAALDGPCTDPGLLPPGRLAVFNGVAHFLPAASEQLLPPGFAWKGFSLGRAERGGSVRLQPRLRALMPPARELGRAALVVEDIAPLLGLLTGKGLAVDAEEREIGLYFQNVPLCRLPVKGRRALLPPH